MKLIRFPKYSSAFLGSALLAGSSALYAQVQLEEVIVTAQKRAESLQDVSVSVSALDGDFMAEGGIARVEEIASYVPNLSFSETGIGTNIYIRGIGSGINQGFEQSVGMYVDGIYYGRAQLTRAPIFDMERVEVLRGPQVTLFGNNSVGGALSLLSKKPSSEAEVNLSALYEPEDGEREFIVSISDALGDNGGFRLSYRNYALDGYIYNATLNTDEPNRDFETVRLSLAYDFSDSLTTNLKLERSTFDINGRQIRMYKTLPSQGFGASGTNYANDNPVAGMTYNDIVSGFASVGGATVANPESDHRYSNGDVSNNTMKGATFSLEWLLPNDAAITSIVGHLEYAYDEQCDCDFSGAQLVPLDSNEAYEQQSFELRLTSPGGEFVDYIAGIYLQQDELDFTDKLSLLPAPSGLFDLLSGISTVAAGAPLLVDRAVPREFAQETESQSLFGQLTFNFNDAFRASLGLRFSRTEKEASRELTYTNLDGSEVDPITMINLDIVYASLFRSHRHAISGDRKEDRVSYDLTFEWDASADVLVYASAKRGFKAGGYDVRSNAPASESDVEGFVARFNQGSFEFEDEEVHSFEIGTKLSVWDAAELNIAYFYTDLKDLQISIFDGALGFNVGNAAKAVSQGIELDGRMALTETLMLAGSLAWLDFEFKDYKDGLCTAAQQLATAQSVANNEAGAARGFDPDGDVVAQGTECTVSYDGRTNQYVADYAGALSLMYENDISSGLLMRASLDVNFTDAYFTSQNLEPLTRQGAYEKYNARISLADADEKWEVALLGRNLTDKRIVTYSNDAPLSTSQLGAPSFYAFFERGRTVALQGKYNLY